MQKKIQDTDTTQHNSSVPPENSPMNKNMIRSVVCSLLAVILFAWALMNFDIIMKFFNKVISLFSPFLIGGGIAFLINVILNPLERCWNKVCKKAPAKLTRPVCLTLSSVLVLGILFAVIFMMIPSLWKSVDEFIQNIPIYIEEIRHWWMDTVRFAAKYNIVLPEYAIDSDLLIRKITALINDNMGCSYLRPFRSDRRAFGIYLCLIPAGKKRSGRSPLKEADRNDTSAKEGKAASGHRLTDKSDFYQLCQRAAYRGCHYRNSLFSGNADSEASLRRCHLNICCFYRIDTGLWCMARRRSWCFSDPVGRSHQSCLVHYLSAASATGGRQSDISKSCWEICWSSRAACTDGSHCWR